ncbi:serine hydrolase domain-containing protein [Litorimonas haliclonae]|uniref:serine hydrolase domain-containing protein n=1 Tax=Litorimonas haliclonae TaxID=2081977 RepID=UPI0039EDF7D2
MTETPFDIFAADGLDPAVEAFKANFKETDEIGAQFCLMREGEVLLDLKGGWMDRQQTMPVHDDTLFSVFSTGKAMAALVIAWLAEEDRLGYNQPVTTLWPDFGQHGKDKLTIAQIMSHQSGLPGITDMEWKPEDWFDWEKTIKTLAAQEPIFEPGTQTGYHPVTYGFLAGEIARLADEPQRHLGHILREELAAPFDADVWIGLPASEHERCAQIAKPKAMADLGEMNAATKAAFMSKAASPGGKGAAAWREAQLAGSNCHATAKGLATLMQIAVNGRCGDAAVLSEDTLTAFREKRIGGDDLVLPFEINFAAGVMLNTPNYFYGPTAETVGHSGWGGSCVFADPKTGLHGAYVMNRQHNTLIGDNRSRRLIDAAYAALGNSK